MTALTNKRGIFSVLDVRERQSTRNWTNRNEVFLPVSPYSASWEYGYFGGGGPAAVSTVDRIDYANDTATASVRGPLSAVRYSLAATSGETTGLF
jgi:hypothetical protein